MERSCDTVYQTMMRDVDVFGSHGSGGSRKFVGVGGGGGNICWLFVVAGYLVIGENSSSRSRSVVIHIFSRLCLVAIPHGTVLRENTCPSYGPAPPIPTVCLF